MQLAFSIVILEFDILNASHCTSINYSLFHLIHCSTVASSENREVTEHLSAKNVANAGYPRKSSEEGIQ